MSRDYKNAAKKKDSGPGLLASAMPFTAGLAIGLFVAFIVFLTQSDGAYIPFKSRPANTSTAAAVTPEDTMAPTTESVDNRATPPAPKFDFYNILPNKEINISEWVAEEQVLQTPVPQNDTSVYILQVGSFKQLEAADQVKAQLALLGVLAEIQRVVIDGRDTIYRVRIGPYSDQGNLNQDRQRLEDNNLEYMLLKLQADDPRASNG
jgi:cell division protein FtsN